MGTTATPNPPTAGSVIIKGTGIKPLASIKNLLKSNLPSSGSLKIVSDESFDPGLKVVSACANAVCCKTMAVTKQINNFVYMDKVFMKWPYESKKLRKNFSGIIFLKRRNSDHNFLQLIQLRLFNTGSQSRCISHLHHSVCMIGQSPADNIFRKHKRCVKIAMHNIVTAKRKMC